MTVRPVHRVRAIVSIAFLLSLAACGGGGGGSTTASPAPGLTVPATTYAGLSVDSAGGDAGGDSAGAAGAAGDGAPVAFADVTIKDATGKSVTAQTDAAGAYRATITGFTSPLVATVSKGSRVLTSFSTSAPAPRKTVLINLTGLTDKIASDLVQANGGVGASNLTPAIVSAQSSKIVSIINAVNTSISDVLKANGLDPATFDPMTSALVTNHAGYDAVLDSLSIVNGPSTSTQIVPLTPLQAAKQFIKDLRDTAGAYSNGSTGDLDVAGDKLDNAIKAATSPIDEDVLKIMLLFSDAEVLYNDYKAGKSTDVQLSSGKQVVGQTVTKSVSGAAVGPSILPEYGCELNQVTTQTTSSGETDLLTSRYAGAFSLTPPASAPQLLPSEVNAFSCYGFGTVGRMLGTELDDGVSRFHLVTFLPQSDGSFKFVAQVQKHPFDMTGNYPVTATSSVSTRDGAAKFGTVTRKRASNGDLTAWNISGQAKAGFKHLRSRTVAEWNKFSHQTLSLNLTDTLGTTSRTLALDGSFNLINSDSTVASSAAIAPKSTVTRREDLTRVTTYPYNNGAVACRAPDVQQAGSTAPNIICLSSDYTPIYPLSDMNLVLSISAPGVKFEGTFLASDPKRDSTGLDTSFKVTSASFVGKIFEGDGAGGYRELLEGTVTLGQPNRDLVNTSVPETATNYLTQTWEFGGKVFLLNRPELRVALKGRNDSFTTQSMTGSFVWDGAWGFDITGTRNTATDVGSTTFSSATGVTFTLPRHGSSSPQKIFKGSLEVGTITLSTKRVDYTDGSFEQF